MNTASLKREISDLTELMHWSMRNDSHSVFAVICPMELWCSTIKLKFTEKVSKNISFLITMEVLRIYIMMPII